jgi:hypothetical protein
VLDIGKAGDVVGEYGGDAAAVRLDDVQDQWLRATDRRLTWRGCAHELLLQETRHVPPAIVEKLTEDFTGRPGVMPGR